MKRLVISGWWLLVVLLLNPFSTVQSGVDKLRIFVSIVPQKYFVEKIGGDLVDVSIMVLPGASPATYEPKPRQMAQLSGTDIYFALGVPFEKTWLPRITAVNPGMRVIHTDVGLKKIPMTAHDHLEDEEGHGPEHQPGGIEDPHIWLSPPLVMVQARHIVTALIGADPENKPAYEENYKQFILELVELDMEIRGLLSIGGHFMVFHPAWGYFARAYGLEQIPVEVEGKEPRPAQLRNLIRLAREKEIRALFVQPEFSTRSAELIAREINGQVIRVSPLAENWAANLRQVALKIKEALR